MDLKVGDEVRKLGFSYDVVKVDILKISGEPKAVGLQFDVGANRPHVEVAEPDTPYEIVDQTKVHEHD